MATIVRSEPTTGRVERRKRRRWPLVTLAVVTVATLVYMLSAYAPPVMRTVGSPCRAPGISCCWWRTSSRRRSPL